MTAGLDSLTRVRDTASQAERFISEHASLSAAVSTLGSTETTLVVDTQQSVGSSLTIPANITLRVTNTGSFSIGSSQTLTIQSAIIAPPRQIFLGSGVARFTGNTRLAGVYANWWGAKGDDSTDCASSLQAAVDCFDASNLDGRILFAPGVYRIAGALQDTGNSNSQIVLPKRTGTQLAITFEGTIPSSNMNMDATTAGVVIKSTLTSGSGGAMIGVKGTNLGGGTSITFHAKNITFRMPTNPTHTALDLRYAQETVLENLKVDTGQTYNAVTQPTTTTSYGIRTHINNVGAMAWLKNVSVAGFYNGIEWNELTDGDEVAVTNNYRGIVTTEAFHTSAARRILAINNTYGIVGTGGLHYLHISNYDIEHTADAAWYANVADIYDPSNYLVGTVHWHNVAQNVGPSGTINRDGTAAATTFNIVGASNLKMPGYSGVFYEIFSGFNALAPTGMEYYRGASTSGDTNFGALSLGNNQTGTNATVGIIPFWNMATGGGEKRIAQIGAATDGAVNSGKINFTTWNAGTSTVRFSITKSNVLIPGLPVYANNAAAVAGGLAVGTLYRSGGDPDTICVVH
jgi:hypothetical protein